MTKQEYTDYQETVKEFFSHGLRNLSAKHDEAFFSWSPCQCCHTHLGGDRYECNGFNSVTNEIEDYSCICQDCVYYSEYGQLDDQTMEGINENLS